MNREELTVFDVLVTWKGTSEPVTYQTAIHDTEANRETVRRRVAKLEPNTEIEKIEFIKAEEL